MTDVELARVVASKFHAGQMYGRNPYIYHLEAVATSVRAEHDDRLEVIAYLHDILEDTDCTDVTLFQLFDNDIVYAVAALTKVEGESYEAYIARVKLNALALIVKMHDTLCNLTESLIRRDMKRVTKYANQMKLLAEK